MKSTEWIVNFGVLLIFGLMSIFSQAQTFSTLLIFNQNSGTSPYYAPVQASDGNLYGTTFSGGPNRPTGGTIFKITMEGTLTTLYNFCRKAKCADGWVPNALFLAADGDFYSTTEFGGQATTNCPQGCGTVFRFTNQGRLATEYAFSGADGADPMGPVAEGTDKSIYGTTSVGGANSLGSIFKINSAGILTTLYSFGNLGDGIEPTSGLLLATNGNFYGTASFGAGNQIDGTAFRITPHGKYSIIYSFSGSAHPMGPLIQGFDRNVYLTTCGYENTPDYGAVWKIKPNGPFTILHRFDGIDGQCPKVGVVEATDGNLYGTTSEGGDPTCNPPDGCGTLFQLSPSGVLTTLHVFEGNDGANGAGLMQATNGSFYGITNGGGDNSCYSGCGTIFKLDVGLDPFVAFVRDYGKAGQTAEILGQALTGTTTVSLNGIPMNFNVVSDTYLTATIPNGATTGYVTVTTSSGALTSNVPFTVIQ